MLAVQIDLDDLQVAVDHVHGGVTQHGLQGPGITSVAQELVAKV